MADGPRADRCPIAILAGPGDAALTMQLLTSAGIEAKILDDGEALLAMVRDPCVGGVIVDEDLLRGAAPYQLAAALEEQPPWSDLPLIVVRPPHRPGGDWWHNLPHASVTILERPLTRDTMEAAVRSALRARARQYEVRDLLKRLQEENQLKDQFIAMLGHELRNPLSVIASAAQMLDRNPTKSPRYRDLIHRQVSHLSRIVDDLLDISRMMHGKLSIRREPLDLSVVLRRCVEECGPAIARRSLELRTSIPDQPLFVNGDLVRLDQVFSNLVTNAVKYTPEHGRITIDLTQTDDGWAAVSIKDSGVGIPAPLMPRLFELFVQGDQTIARTSGGLGMGLALVKSIVELHGGEVRAFSEGEGRGAEFLVTLPLTAARPQVHPAVEAPEERSSLRIVLVEDNVDTRESLEDFLRTKGHVVSSAGDGRDGADLIVSIQPDVAVVDIGLPSLDGYEVARHVRARTNGSVRLLALTGYGQPQDRQMAFEAGFDAHLVKPVDPPNLLRMLASLTAGNRDNQRQHP